MQIIPAQMNPQGIPFEEFLSDTPAHPRLALGEPQLWAVRLNPERARVDSLAALLSLNEVTRAGRYHFARDRRRYVVRWGFVRSLLGHYLARPPQALRFGSGPVGKPFLIDDPGLHFNLSHSGDLALIGVSRDVPLGVDIENTRLVEDADAIVRRLFTPREVAAYFGVPACERPVVFFNCWTRKEAFVKARGEGLSLSLKLFDVSVLPGEDARIVAINGAQESAHDWTLIHLEPAPGFIGALAMQQSLIKVSAWIVDLDRTALPSQWPVTGH